MGGTEDASWFSMGGREEKEGGALDVGIGRGLGHLLYRPPSSGQRT
jgi:hypothetical protein